LIIKAELLPDTKMTSLLDECTQLGKIIGQSVVTARQKSTKKR